jgi:hypothetical protein
MKDLEVKEIFEKVSEGVSGITSVVINLVALAIISRQHHWRAMGCYIFGLYWYARHC